MLLALTVMWGTAFTLTKIAVTELAPAQVVGARLLVGAAVLLLMLAVMRRAIQGGRRRWLFYLAIAVVGNALPFTLISWGQQTIDSGQAGILMACMPLITLVLGHFTLPDERLSLPRVGGFMLGLAGVIVLIGPENLPGAGQAEGSLVPMLAVLGGAACYAVAAILARLRPPSEATGTAAATTLIATALMLPWLAFGVGDPAPLVEIGAGAWLAVLLLGVFSTAIAAIVYFRLVARAGPAFVSQLNYLIPLWAVGIGVVFLGEQPSASHLYALLLILAGIYLAQRGRTTSADRQPARAGDAGLGPGVQPAWAEARGERER